MSTGYHNCKPVGSPMVNDLDNGLIYYRFKREDGTTQIQCFDHGYIEHFIQDQIADRLVYRDRVLCVCRAQLTKAPDGTLRTIPALNTFGFKSDVPELLVLTGPSIGFKDLIAAIKQDHAKIQQAKQTITTNGWYKHRARQNDSVRQAIRSRARAQREFWNEENV